MSHYSVSLVEPSGHQLHRRWQPAILPGSKGGHEVVILRHVHRSAGLPLVCSKYSLQNSYSLSVGRKQRRENVSLTECDVTSEGEVTFHGHALQYQGTELGASSFTFLEPKKL
jgi:hypothetical protein